MKNKRNQHDEIFSSRYVDSFYKLSKYRTIFIVETITKELASTVTAMLFYFDSLSKEEEIVMYINTNGGETSALANIYDVMQMISAPIKTVCLGKAYSAGAVILAAGNKGNRFALKNSNIMIHGIQVIFPTPSETDMVSSKEYYEFLEEHNYSLIKMLSHHTGKSIEDISKDCKRDYFMSSKEAIEYGIIDDIIE